MLNDASRQRPLRTLVLGGTRSGKSAFAEELAGRSGPVRYVATAAVDPADGDFADRVAAHRERRPADWQVVEGDPVRALAEPTPMTLIDDLGTWLTGRIDARAAWESPRGTVAPDVEELVAAIAGYQQSLVIVSPETGLGVLPGTRSGRLFTDEIGTLNQRVAALCDEVYLVVAGVPVPVREIGNVAAAGTSVDARQHPAEGSVAAGEGATQDTVAPDGVGAAGSGTVAQVAAAGTLGTREEVAARDSAVAPDGAGALAAVGSVGGAQDSANGSAAVSAIPGAADPMYDLSGEAPVFGIATPPDQHVRVRAQERQLQLTKPAGALGRLETLGNWVAACQGVCPPRQFERARVVVFAGDHGIARHGVSAYPSEVTVQMVANIVAGGAAVNALARLADATVRVVDIAVDADTDPVASAYKVRRSSGAIDREDALTEAEVNAALAAGRAIADEEIDGGADLLIAGDLGIGNTTPATVLIATITDTEPVLAVGRGTGIDDAGWMRKAAAVRDAMWRARPHLYDPVALLRVAGGADLAAMAGYLAQAAVRRTPVILDGAVVTSAALIADALAPGASAWWVAGHRSTEPAHSAALTKLGLEPLVEMDMRLGEGSGAVTALPVLRAAVAALTEMATFGEAGVSTADDTAPATP
ncbi:nicotinate-nucleotide--dimethylbenzimidazole phosphoribosyltransferase [Nocardia macrotermitis]|uniref:nicotinate-nucleotide--dimethylbenzimidazole phosphoribosyltransferase n=1 Tax=Nocardia macrotermitis TaxID=2585198 RepID=UPI0029E7F9A0|nr:nicotinate-nucleotide--dimethylbenzimidazole phosphoribosyltransferase [Nocardia macrotermitis]